MKVTMVAAEKLPVPPALGGAVEQTLYETAVAVREPELTVISPWAEALRGVEVHPEGIFYHVNVRAQAVRVRNALGKQLPPGLRNPRAARRFYYLNGVTDLLLDIDPDVIQVHNRPESVPYLLKQFPGKRMVLYVHSEQAYSDPRFDCVVGDIDRLVFVSGHLARQFTSRYPEYGRKATVIHNSVDTDVWRPELKEDRETEEIRRKYGLPPGRTALFVGRTVPQKGIHCLLGAMEEVRRRLPDAKLLVVGSPFFGMVSSDPFLKRLKEQALRMGDAVVFAGYVERRRTPCFYAAADVTVAPSIGREAFGKVVIESMATGVPVIGSRVGGIPEIIEDGADGILVDDPKDVGLLARQIVSLLENSERRREMGAAARRKAVDRFGTLIRLARTRAFYRALEAGCRGG